MLICSYPPKKLPIWELVELARLLHVARGFSPKDKLICVTSTWLVSFRHIKHWTNQLEKNHGTSSWTDQTWQINWNKSHGATRHILGWNFSASFEITKKIEGNPCFFECHEAYRGVLEFLYLVPVNTRNLRWVSDIRIYILTFASCCLPHILWQLFHTCPLVIQQSIAIEKKHHFWWDNSLLWPCSIITNVKLLEGNSCCNKYWDLSAIWICHDRVNNPWPRPKILPLRTNPSCRPPILSEEPRGSNGHAEIA